MLQPQTETGPFPDLHNNLLTSSDFHEIKDLDLNEESEYKEYKYRFKLNFSLFSQISIYKLYNRYSFRITELN